MGLSSKKQKTSSAETSTATTTPNVPSFLSQPYQAFASNVSQLNPSGMGAVGPSALQRSAFSAAQGLGGGQATMRGLMNYAPGSVQAGQLASTDLSPYMNPYTSEVIDRSLADLSRVTQGQIADNQGRATMAGAYGGSRHGVADAGIYEGAQRTGGDLAANLRNQGFMTAQNAALSDIGNRLNADQFNVGSGLQGAGLRLNAANALGADERANVGLMGDLGEQQRAIELEQDPWRRQAMALAMQGGLLGAIPANLFTGQTVNASGTSNSTTKETASGMDIFGKLLGSGLIPIPGFGKGFG